MLGSPMPLAYRQAVCEQLPVWPVQCEMMGTVGAGFLGGAVGEPCNLWQWQGLVHVVYEPLCLLLHNISLCSTDLLGIRDGAC
jgi:hypothetical protein